MFLSRSFAPSEAMLLSFRDATRPFNEGKLPHSGEVHVMPLDEAFRQYLQENKLKSEFIPPSG